MENGREFQIYILCFWDFIVLGIFITAEAF